MKIDIKKLPKSEVEILGTIEVDDLETFRAKALKHLSEHADLPGFRKGHIPDNVLTAAVPEHEILEEMAEMAIASRYPEIIMGNKIDAIGRPNVTTIKLAKGNPFEFKIVTAVVPEIALPDYKKIASKITSKEKTVEITEEDVEKVLLEIRKQRAPKMTASAEGSGAPKTDADGKPVEIKDEDLPEINDEFVKTLGGFKDVADLHEKIKENLKKEKEQQAKEKVRMEIIKEILAATKMEIPDILVESELQRMIAQFKHDVAQMGIKFEEYLSHIKKTEDDMRKEWGKDAEDRAKTQLIIDKIAEDEKIVAEKDLVEKEVEHILEHYTEADHDAARGYVAMVMTNDKVLEFLEKAK